MTTTDAEKMRILCREAIMTACVGRERYTVNELLADFDANIAALSSQPQGDAVMVPREPTYDMNTTTGAEVMGKRMCIVCKRDVPEGYESDHLAANHLGPHTFWLNMRQHQTMKGSLSAAEVKKIGDTVSMLPLIEERDGGDYYYYDAEAVDLTRGSHFYTVQPATMHRDLPA